MALADDIRALRDRALAELNAVHDYYVDSKTAWDIVDQFVNKGSKFAVSNPATGSTSTESDLPAKARRYIAGYLAESTFQQFLSIFENFFFDLLRFWLVAFPQSLGAKTVEFKSILNAPDKDAITLMVVNKEINEIMYERPAAWFTYLEGRVRLGCPPPDEIDRLAEAKASRDILAHNRGIINKTYLVKAGKLARFVDGDRIEIPEAYHRQSWDLLSKMIADVCNAAAARAV